MNCATCRTEEASWGACVSWDWEVFSEFLKGLTQWFDEPFLSSLRFRFWVKACENWMLPVTGWEAAVQPPSSHARVQLSPATGWSTAGGQAALPRGHSARERFGITLLLPSKTWCVLATGHQWQMGRGTETLAQHRLQHLHGVMMPPVHRFCAQAGSRRHFRFGAGQL